MESKSTLELRICDLESFKDLVNALGEWALEVNNKSEKSDAEQALFDAAIYISDKAKDTPERKPT